MPTIDGYHIPVLVFKEQTAIHYAVRGYHDKWEHYGSLWKNHDGTWGFKASQYIHYTAEHLKEIQEQLDRLNSNGI